MSKYPAWVKVLAIITGVVLILVLGRACMRAGNPTQYIETTYQRAAELDEGGMRAFVAPTTGPHSVASAISADVEPLDRRAAPQQPGAAGDPGTTQASGDAVFLAYDNHIVAIFPHGDGSRIMLGSYSQGRSHYFVYVGNWWPSTSSYSGGGSSNRGGGSGSGK